MAYANGYVPLTALTSIGDGLYLLDDAAQAWLAAQVAVERETGIKPYISRPDGAYRSFARQVFQKQDAINDGDPMRAATPGTSTHGWGLSVDINNIWQYGQAQLDKIMARYGFKRNVARESWHYTYFPGTATASLDVTRIPEQESEHIMSQIQYYERAGTTQQEWMIAGEELPGGYEVTLNKTQALIWGRQYSGEGTIPVHVDRDTYIAAQAYWKARAAKWEARQVARIKAVFGTPTAGGPTAEQITDAVRAALPTKYTTTAS